MGSRRQREQPQVDSMEGASGLPFDVAGSVSGVEASEGLRLPAAPPGAESRSAS